MKEPNIYEPPKVNDVMPSGVNQTANGFTDGGVLYIKKGFEAPAVCIVSGEPVSSKSRQYKLTVSYVPPLAYLLIFIGVIGWICIALLQKSVRYKVYLSEEHAKRFRRNKWIGRLSFLLSITGMFVGGLYDIPYAIVGGVLLILFTLFWSVLTNRVVKFIRYKDGYFQLSKAHKNFLEHIPKPLYPSSNIQINDIRDTSATKIEVVK